MAADMRDKNDRKGDRDMARVKVRRAAEITLPDEARQRLGVSEGDYLDVELVEGGVLLKPLPDRERARERLIEIISTPKWRGPGPQPSEDEVMEMVVEEIHTMRREDDESRSR
jgi:AbrB family looped-hinge helix DNA binding protein